MDENKKIPKAWANNKSLPENWGQGSKAAHKTTEENGRIISEAEKEANELLDTGVKIVTGAARIVGNKAKKAAIDAVDYARSDEVKEKLNSAKDKARSIAGGAGAALSGLKEKTSDTIKERRLKRQLQSQSSNNADSLPVNDDERVSEDSGFMESVDDTDDREQYFDNEDLEYDENNEDFTAPVTIPPDHDEELLSEQEPSEEITENSDSVDDNEKYDISTENDAVDAYSDDSANESSENTCNEYDEDDSECIAESVSSSDITEETEDDTSADSDSEGLSDNDQVNNLIAQAEKEIENCRWKYAVQCCRSAIEIDESDPLPFLYLAVCSEKAGSVDELADLALKNGLLSNKDFRTAFENADDGLRNTLSEMNIQTIYNYFASLDENSLSSRESFGLLTSLYRNIYRFMHNTALTADVEQMGNGYLYEISCAALSRAKTYGEYDHVSQMFSQLSGYEDSEKLAEECMEEYLQSIRKLIDADDSTVSELEAAVNDLKMAHGVKGAYRLEQECQDKLEAAIIRDRYYSDQGEQLSSEALTTKHDSNPMLIGLIAFLVVLLCILGIAFFILIGRDSGNKTSNPEPEGDKPVQQQVTSESTTVIEETTTEAAAETEVTAEIVTTKAVPERIDTSAAVNAALKEHLDAEYKKENDDPYYFFDRDVKYALYDVDTDGTDELFVSYQGIETISTDMYVFANGKYEKLKCFYEGANVCLETHLMKDMLYGGGEKTTIFSLNGGSLRQEDELAYLPDPVFYHNDTVITQNEYNSLISEYNSMTWIRVPDNSKPVSDLIDMSAYKERPETKYTRYDTSAAGSGFEFYPSARDCKVNTESDDLNLRATPSANGEIILRIPKNQPVHEYGHDHAWSYVSYNKDGKTYYGYVSKQFILDVNELVQIYPCNKYGTIKVSSGTLSGFKSSYVVDGGQPETVDVVLENGHPVRAFNYCSSKDILWYEVYDEETGEYCGWFDSDFLNF